MNNARFKKPFERLTNVDECRLLNVIEVKSLVGEGDGIGSPMRQIVEYFSVDGELLARKDSYVQGKLENGIFPEEVQE